MRGINIYNDFTFKREINIKYNNLTDKELMTKKSDVLYLNLNRELNKIKRLNYHYLLQVKHGICFINYGYEIHKQDIERECQRLNEMYDSLDLKIASNLNRAKSARTTRLKKKIEEVITSDNAIFVTLTFTDEVLNNTNAETRRTYVRKYLASQSDFYVANIDYGAKNDREHYHAVVSGRVKHNAWKHGAINFKKVRTTSSDVSRVASYVSKLTNHAIKHTTKQFNIIYSRERNGLIK